MVSVVCVLCLLYVAWHTGLLTWFSIGSLLPYSDADEYVNGAKSLITFGELGQWSARRPLGTSFIAVALWVTNQNYQWSLILLALATGVATFFAVRQTWLTGGLLAAVVYLALSALVLIQWGPQFMSERAGYVFASLSYALLLSAFRRRSFPESLVGMAFLVLAQAARPGAILAVATVGGYLIYYFSSSLREALRKGLIIVAIGAAVWAVNPLLLLKIGPPKAGYEGAIPYTLYGLAAGGKPWNYVLTEHPEIIQLPSEQERSEYAYRLFQQKIAAQPGVFILAIAQKFWDAIRHPASVYFGLVPGISSAIVAIFALIGLVLLVRSTIWRTTAWAFLPPTAIGVLFSAPFLFDTGVRGYMSIIPFELAFAVVPIAFGVDRLRKNWSNNNSPAREYPEQFPLSEVAFSIALTAAVTLIPIWISLTANPEIVSSALQKTGIAPNEGVFYFNRQSGILIEGRSPPADILNVRLASVLEPADRFARELDAPYYIFRGDFLYHALLLIHPSAHEDVVVSYVVFDRVPETPPGYLIVALRLVMQNGKVALFKADGFRRLDL